MVDIAEFHQELISDVQVDADAMGLITVEAFFDKIGELLTEAGELEQANRAFYQKLSPGKPIQIDGYGGDPRDSQGVLSLLLCDFSTTEEIQLIRKDRLQVLLNKLNRFLISSLRREFRDQLEESSSGFGVADLIARTWKDVEKVKLIVVTNGDCRTKADAIKVTEVDGRPVTLSVWDLKRLKQYMEQGHARGSLLIDFERDFGGGIPLLPASGGDAALESYLAVIPGRQLADIYDKWGARLLEANVRSFLQARGKVNRGIRDTIRKDPHMFFPYNNGLSATADDIETVRTADGLKLVNTTNFQIVNGGQTTASLHAARKLAPEQLDHVYVQMKLTIVPKDQSEAVVPLISEFANSQNKVNAADFFSNHPFHIRVEELSRKVLARSQGAYRDTKWFYERARGQFADERGRRSPAERKKFDAEFPRAQFFTKTDLAKYENSWDCIPHVVSLGAQKNFAAFAKQIGKRWGTNGSKFDDLWFKRLIAKAIIFKSTEKLVSNSNWYQGDYRANIVTYSISKIVHDARERQMVIDLDKVWRQQEISEDLRSAIDIAGEAAQAVIINPPEGVRNFGEWAKKEACWKGLSDRKLQYLESFDATHIKPDIFEERERDERKDNMITESAEAEIEVHRLGALFWSETRNWARERGLLSPMEAGVLDTCSAIPQKIPSEKQCAIALAALAKLRERGYQREV